MWIARAMHEIRESERTWFATLTFRPEEHYRLQAISLARAAARSIPTKELSSLDVERMQWKAAQREVTLFLKRVRKAVGMKSLRYVLVQEKHKSGLPHYHLLMHESDPAQPIKYAALATAWSRGFAKFKLIGDDQRAAFYVCKYLAKANEGRVRASLRYGQHAQKPSSEIVSCKASVMSSAGPPVETKNVTKRDT